MPAAPRRSAVPGHAVPPRSLCASTHAAYSVFQVRCPTTPSAVRLCFCWNARTARSVAAP